MARPEKDSKTAADPKNTKPIKDLPAEDAKGGKNVKGGVAKKALSRER